MSDHIRLKFDSSKFEAALLRLYAATHRDLSSLLKEMARLFVKEVVLITPPGGGGVQGPKARQRGAARVEQDVRRVFRELKHEKWHSPEIRKAIRERDMRRLHEILPHIPELAGMELYLEPSFYLHRNAKNARGVVPPNHKQNILVLGGLRQYIKGEQAKVGKLASGWNSAAAALGVKLSAWVDRHGAGRGTVILDLQEPSMSIRMDNNVRYASHTHDMNRRVQWALNSVASRTMKRVDKIVAANARAASLKSTLY